MFLPGTGLDRDLAKWFVDVVLQDREVKAELAKQIRVESSTAKNKYSQYSRATFDSLTMGDVNLQYRMAQSGYDVYGRTILAGNESVSGSVNESIRTKMKNKIRYGRKPEDGYENRGGYKII